MVRKDVARAAAEGRRERRDRAREEEWEREVKRRQKL